METIISTEHSQLNIYDLDTEMLPIIDKCIMDVDNELMVKPEIIVYGKVCRQNRSVNFYSDTAGEYNYSTSKTPSKKLHPSLRELLLYVNTKFDSNYNGILINKYSGGTDYIGKHSDDERTLDKNNGVILISYGETRKFRIRDKATNTIIADVETDPLKIIQMSGKFQKEFTHEIPIEKTKKGIRYSFTFRKHS
jgi:alkylated DNA repair dioxygenase AlkB